MSLGKDEFWNRCRLTRNQFQVWTIQAILSREDGYALLISYQPLQSIVGGSGSVGQLSNGMDGVTCS